MLSQTLVQTDLFTTPPASVLELFTKQWTKLIFSPNTLDIITISVNSFSLFRQIKFSTLIKSIQISMVGICMGHGCTVVLRAQQVWLWTGQGRAWVHGLTWLRAVDNWQCNCSLIISKVAFHRRTGHSFALFPVIWIGSADKLVWLAGQADGWNLSLQFPRLGSSILKPILQEREQKSELLNWIRADKIYTTHSTVQ